MCFSNAKNMAKSNFWEKFFSGRKYAGNRRFCRFSLDFFHIFRCSFSHKSFNDIVFTFVRSHARSPRSFVLSLAGRSNQHVACWIYIHILSGYIALCGESHFSRQGLRHTMTLYSYVFFILSDSWRIMATHWSKLNEWMSRCELFSTKFSRNEAYSRKLVKFYSPNWSIFLMTSFLSWSFFFTASNSTNLLHI